MALDIKLSNEELLTEFHQHDESTQQNEVSRLTELYHFADFGRLSAGLFHDLATPLHIVLVNLEELQEKCADINDEKMKELQSAIDRAFNGTERMMRFLELARQHVQRKQVLSMFSLNDEITQAIALLMQTSNTDDVVITFAKTKEIRVFGNSTEFFQIILNLLSNAKDAYSEVTKKKKIEVHLKQTKTRIFISVKDWGEGIGKENAPFVFQPFFTTKATNKGSGIGLFISKDIIEKQFRGTISFSSSSTHTTFTVDLPRRAALRASE